MIDNKTILLECEIFPCIAWFQKYLTFSNVVIEQHEYFERATLRNRYYITGSNGLIILSIPLQGGRNQKKIMKDLKISYDEKWQTLHWKTINSCYHRSPFFEYYEQNLAPLFLNKYDFLLDFNVACLETIKKSLKIKKEYTLNLEYKKEFNDGLDFRKKINASNFQLIENLPVYTQVFNPITNFEKNLSILDQLFCEGKTLLDRLMD